MKLITLMENTALPGLAAEHGLSLYLEAAGKKILFDAGQSGAFGDNAEKLGVDLGAIDLAILSHGHYDHGNGLLRFREINPRVPIYLSTKAFETHRNAQGKDIGLAEALSRDPHLIFVGESLEIAPGLTIESCTDRICRYPLDTGSMTANGRPETFDHEICLLAEEGEKRILISGCSHKGVGNLLHWFFPDIFVGGFHFMKIREEARLEAAARLLASYDASYYTGHCTGEAQFAFLKARLGERLREIPAGSVFDL